MNSLIVRFGIAAAALGGLALAGCNAIEDVREEPYIATPVKTVALNGIIYGLGNKRAVVLMNNGNTADARPFVAAVAVKPAPTSAGSITPFSFGPVPVTTNGQPTPYEITVKEQPYGKNCVPNAPNNAGVITTQKALNIVITCTDITDAGAPGYRPRYAIRVQVPDAFINSADAKVTLVTEDGYFEKTDLDAANGTVACGANRCVEFPAAVVSVPTVCTPAITNGAPCAANTPVASVQPAGVVFRYAQSAFPYTVTASNTEGGVLNKCRVDNPTNVTVGTSTLGRPTTSATQPAVIVVPTGDVTNVVVGSCDFTISGTVSYNGSSPPAMGAGGLTMELRDARGNLLQGTSAVNVTSFGAFTLTNIARSNQQNGLLDVVITRHPDGQFCIFDTSSNLNLFVLGVTTNPTNKTVSVQCRARPVDPARQLKGIYRQTSTTYQANSSAAVIGPVEWRPFSQTQQNIASSNMIAFFEDGTFLYGTHAATTSLILVQIEHGFYDFDPVNQVLRLSVVADTNPCTFFGQTSGTNCATGPANTTFANSLNRVGTPGLSAVPGFVASGTAKTATMTNVQFGTVPVVPANNIDPPARTLSGSFGTLTATTPRLDWVLTEPISRPGEWTGTWVSEDHRRFVVWDFNTLYVTHIGVSGGSANMQDVCLSTDNLHAPFGLYVRRATATGCYPLNRIFPGQTGYVITSFEAPDAPVSASNQQPFRVPDVATTPLSEIPGFVGRLPGGAPQFDLRSPSPMYYRVLPANQMANNNRQDLYPSPIATSVPYTPAAPLESWCPVEAHPGTGEILGLRATLNDTPIDYPVYMCRYRVP